MRILTIPVPGRSLQYAVTLAALLAGWEAAAEVPPTSLLGIRSAPWEDRFRIVLDLSAPATFPHQVLSAPDRVVIDLPETAAGEIPTPKIDEWMVASIIVSRQPQGAAQVVIGLAQPFDVKVFSVPAQDGKPFRVVCDIYRPRPAETTQEHWVVSIDPGHGGRDPGAVHQRLREKTVNLDVARRLAGQLNRVPGVVARLTRDRDTFVSLPRRQRKAEEAQADAFVSIHVNGCRSRAVRGAEVFFLSLKGATDAAAEEIAALENDAARDAEARLPGEIAELPFAVDLIQTDTLHRSSLLAESVLNHLVGSKLAANRGVKQASFAVLRSCRIPSVLIELGFISSPEDARQLAAPAHRQALAEAIATGLLEYREQYARRPEGGP